MTSAQLLRMGDGPPANLPDGLDAYGGYVNDSGIGETWPAVEKIPARYHLSFTTNGTAAWPAGPAMCADVERGAMTDWRGYPVGYCSIANAAANIALFGRPPKLLTAHNDPAIGAHICGPQTCNYPQSNGRPCPQADGTQCRPGLPPGWDFSLLAANFFDFLAPAPGPLPKEVNGMQILETSAGLVVVGAAKDNGNLLVFTQSGAHWGVIDVTDVIHGEAPADPRTYQVT